MMLANVRAKTAEVVSADPERPAPHPINPFFAALATAARFSAIRQQMPNVMSIARMSSSRGAC
jgi:hypothetical protein